MITEGNKIKCGKDGTWHIFDIAEGLSSINVKWNSLKQTGYVTYDNGCEIRKIHFSYDSVEDSIVFEKLKVMLGDGHK